MEAEKRVIEDLLWSDVFSTDITKYIVFFVGSILFFRVLGQIKILRQVKAYVYLIKALTYGILVIMLFMYFRKQGTTDNINVFTGFTLLFSAIEVMDNLLLMFAEWQSSRHMPDDSKKKWFKKEEDNFNDMIKDLMNLQMIIRPGRPDKYKKSVFVKISKRIIEEHFFKIDEILQNKTGESGYFSSQLIKVLNTNMMRKIVRNENRKKQKSLSFNKEEYEEIWNALDEAINCRRLFMEEKLRLIKEKNDLDLV